MIKSIQNDGEFEGGKAMMHTRRCALTRVLLWPVRTPLKHGITKHKSINSHGHSHDKTLTTCKIIINFVYPTVQATVSQHIAPTLPSLVGTLSPLPYNTWYGACSKIFPNFSCRAFAAKFGKLGTWNGWLKAFYHKSVAAREKRYGLEPMFSLLKGVAERTKMGPPDAVFTTHKEDAAWWANRADLEELKYYLIANFNVLSNTEKVRFHKYGSSFRDEVAVI